MTILTKAQAEAINNAMCELNNVSAMVTGLVVQRYSKLKKQELIKVSTGRSGAVYVTLGSRPVITQERYADQAAFATAYGLGA